MIRVTVDLIPFGFGKSKKLTEVHIANTGTSHDINKGNYVVRSYRKNSNKIARTGQVINHQRRSKHVLVLLRKALQAMGY